MVKEERCVLSRNLYKVLLLILKVIPMLCALGCLLNTILAYVGIDVPVLSYIGSMSVLTWTFILIASFVFKFCIYHRIFLYYILIIDVIDTIDYYIGIPISDYNLLVLHIIITGTILFLILYFYVRNHKNIAN